MGFISEIAIKCVYSFLKLYFEADKIFQFKYKNP
ncbi:MAG: hypothetical protein ACI921_001829 [Polaribacter sp.]|jgi:hypothetical protein